MAAGVLLLQCGDCGTLLKSVKEAQQHAESTSHTNFRETSEAILYLLCTSCGKVCNSKTGSNFHTKWTGHTEFLDKTAEEERRAREAERRAREEEERRAREEEERRAREEKEIRDKNVQKLLEVLQAAERNLRGLRPRDPAPQRLFGPVTPATKAEQMRECLRTLKHNHMVEETKVKNAFNTLRTYVKNAWMNPDEEKFRKIRLSNAAFQERIGKVQGGIEFLELCGFEKIEGGQFLYLPREKVDMGVLYSAGNELNTAIDTPFYDII